MNSVQIRDDRCYDLDYQRRRMKEVEKSIKEIVQTDDLEGLKVFIETNEKDRSVSDDYMLQLFICERASERLIELLLIELDIDLRNERTLKEASYYDCAPFFREKFKETWKGKTYVSFRKLIDNLIGYESFKSLYLFLSDCRFSDHITPEIFLEFCQRPAESMNCFNLFIEKLSRRSEYYFGTPFEVSCSRHPNYVKRFFNLRIGKPTRWGHESGDDELINGFFQACQNNVDGEVIKLFLEHDRFNPNYISYTRNSWIRSLNLNYFQNLHLFLDDPRIEVSSQNNLLLKTIISCKTPKWTNEELRKILAKLSQHPKCEKLGSVILEFSILAIRKFEVLGLLLEVFKEVYTHEALNELLEICDKEKRLSISEIIMKQLQEVMIR